MKLWTSRRTEEDAESPTAVEALGMETIAPEGVASARAKWKTSYDSVEESSRRRGEDLAAGGGANDLRGGSGTEEPRL
jgi:hypothetical protein